MKEKTQGERTAWGVAGWIWVLLGVVAGVLVTEFVGPVPWWVAVPAVVGWLAVLLLIMDRGGVFSNV